MTLILKGLQFASIEQHVGEDGRERECNKPYLLLEPHVCSATENGHHGMNLVGDGGKKKQVKRKRKGTGFDAFNDACLDKALKTPISEEETNFETVTETTSNQKEEGEIGKVWRWRGVSS